MNREIYSTPSHPVKALENSQRPLFPQWSHHVYPQFLPGSHPNHQAPPQVVIQQQHHQHYHQQMQQQHHLSNTNNNYINSNAANNGTDNISPILHNNHIINNNHQHLHQNFGQNLNNEIQNATYYQQQHPFMQRTGDGSMMINNTMMTSSGGGAGTNGLAHMKTRNRIVKNNSLNNNFYRSSGTNCGDELFCVRFSFVVCFLKGFYEFLVDGFSGKKTFKCIRKKGRGTLMSRIEALELLKPRSTKSFPIFPFLFRKFLSFFFSTCSFLSFHRNEVGKTVLLDFPILTQLSSPSNFFHVDEREILYHFHSTIKRKFVTVASIDRKSIFS